MCLISLQSINAATINVHPGGSIQSAVNHAHSGDTIVVYDNNKNPYTYKQSVVVNKKVNIISNGKVTIQARTSGSSVFTITKGGSGSSIKNFALTKSNYCILVKGAVNTIISGNRISSASLVGIQYTGTIKNSKTLNNRIIGSNKNVGNGISFQYGSCPYLTSYNTISGNVISNFLNGILFNARAEHNTVAYNKVYCSGYHGAGIYATQASRYIHIIGNQVSGAEDGIAVQKLGAGQASSYLISGNVVKNNKNGFWMTLSNSIIQYNYGLSNRITGIDITGNNNRIIRNIIRYNKVCGIAITTTSSSNTNTLTKNTFSGNGGNYYIVGPGKLIRN